MPHRLCCRNKEAIRWCENRSAIVEFKKDENKKQWCIVSLNGRVKKDVTFIKAVNRWIEFLNERVDSVK